MSVALLLNKDASPRTSTRWYHYGQMQLKRYRYWSYCCAVWGRAWCDTFRFLGWEHGEGLATRSKGVAYLIVPAVIAGIYNSQDGWLSLAAASALLGTGAGMFLLAMLLNLFAAPYRLHLSTEGELEAAQQTLTAINDRTSKAISLELLSLEQFLTVGLTLKSRRLSTDNDFMSWMLEVSDWRNTAADYLLNTESELSSTKFNDVGNREADNWLYAFCDDHLVMRGEVIESCEELERLLQRVKDREGAKQA